MSNITGFSFVVGTFIYWAGDGLLYRITKIEGDGPYSMTYGIVYVRADKRAKEFSKGRDVLLEYVKSGEAVILSKLDAYKRMFGVEGLKI